MSDSSNLLAGRVGQLGLGVQQPESKDRNDLGQPEFFNLMIAQLKNQDPMSPMESNEFLSQLAQFSTVNGIQSIEDSISELAASMQSSQALQASALVGREALVPSAVAPLESGGTVSGAVDLEHATGALELVVTDPAGGHVRTIALGERSGGPVDFAWDGLDASGEPAPPGSYVLSAVAQGADGAEGVPVLVRSHIDSVTLSRNSPGVTLNLRGIGAVDVSEIRELL